MSVSMRFTGAEVLLPEGLKQQELAISEGQISDRSLARTVDLSGYWIMPGMVDIHGDGFERHLAPRRGALRDLGQGLQSADAELAANGITTATLAQFYSWEGGMRGPEFAERFLKAHRMADLLTDTLVQLRVETHMIADYAAIEALIAEHHVPYVVFNDHLPHKELSKGKRPPRLTGQALKGGRSPDAHHALLKILHDQTQAVPAALSALSSRLKDAGVLLGSHDDETAEQLHDFSAMGVDICEFPVAAAAAHSARELGLPIVLGAPNVVRGGSHSGGVSAVDLIAENACDALASDYHYPALKQAAFRLVDDGILPLETAWALVSAGPARLLGLNDRGEIKPGMRADIVILDPKTRRIEASFVAGQLSYLAGNLATRFLN